MRFDFANEDSRQSGNGENHQRPRKFRNDVGSIILTDMAATHIISINECPENVVVIRE